MAVTTFGRELAGRSRRPDFRPEEVPGADTAFVHTFVQPLSPWNPDPRFDFDLASYGLVKSFASRLGELAVEFPKIPWDTTEHGTAYPGMPWRPKESFRAVAAWHAAR